MSDYYKILNIHKTASIKDIQQAYRQLAHLHHPDKPNGSLERFIAVKRAYDVLSDPIERERYDAALHVQTSHTTTSTQTTQQGTHRTQPPTDLHACQNCQKNAPTRYAKFLENIGLIFTRQIKSIEGYFCKTCIEDYFWKYTLTTLILGWWGVMSFFFTIGYLFSNIYHFLQSFSLESTDPERRSKIYAWTVCCLVLGLFGYVGISLISAEYTGTETTTSSTYVPVVPLASTVENVQLLEAIPTMQAKDPATYVSLDNGTLLSKKGDLYLKGLGKLYIENGTDSDAIAKLVNLKTNKSIYTVYIKAHSTYTVDKISDGDYTVLFNLGQDWNALHQAFNLNSSYKMFEEAFAYETAEYDDHYEYTTFSITLNPTAGGRAKTELVNPEEFGAY